MWHKWNLFQLNKKGAKLYHCTGVNIQIDIRFPTFQYDYDFWYILNSQTSVSDMIPGDLEIKSVKYELRRKIILRLSYIYSHHPILVLIFLFITYFIQLYLHPLCMISSIYFLRQLIVNHSFIKTDRTEFYSNQF